MSTPGALVDNDEGQSLVLDALQQMFMIGLDARLRELGTARVPRQLPRVADLQQECATLYERYELLERESPVPGIDGQQAEQLGLETGQTLGLAGGPIKARAWRKLGRDAALQGALLAEALVANPLATREVTSSVHGAIPTAGHAHERLVSVAVAANQAEAELLQGRLREAGIHSIEERTGSNSALMLSGGYRDIYVPADSEQLARELLAPVHRQPDDEDETPRDQFQRFRRIGRATAWLNLAPLPLIPIVTVAVIWDQAGAVAGIIATVLSLLVIGLVFIRVWRRGHFRTPAGQ